MLSIRKASDNGDDAWKAVSPDVATIGLHEDTDYVFSTGNRLDARVFVDDEELRRDSSSFFVWRPCFYAGRVVAEVVLPGQKSIQYMLDVSPSKAKSGQMQFDAMVASIRAFDQTLLGGTSSASMDFGHTGRQGRFAADILLARLRKHGPEFLSAVETIAKSPHRALTVEARVLPLSRIRRLHYSALQDRRLAALVTGHTSSPDTLESLQFNSLTSAPTFDTPANRTLLALLRRFHAALISSSEKVSKLQLGGLPEEQKQRIERRLEALNWLGSRAHKLIVGPLFVEVSSAETSSAGLTQIAAQPKYSRAYRLGCRALSTATDGNDSSDQLHISPSWGIYETWCYIQVIRLISEVTGTSGLASTPRAAVSDRSVSFSIGTVSLEVLFQATFPVLKAPEGRSAWSLSRLRIPDIVLVWVRDGASRAMVLDAKWRSGRQNVLEAMESAHIYHDALRIDCSCPTRSLLLLPGKDTVPELEEDSYIEAHGVGSVGDICMTGEGQQRLRSLLEQWLIRS